jgi:hypothetical protein
MGAKSSFKNSDIFVVGAFMPATIGRIGMSSYEK